MGWETGTVSDVAKVTSGKRPQKRSKEKTVEFNIPLYGGGGIMAYTRDPMLTQPLLLTGRVGTLGKVFRITEPCWPSDNTLLIFPTDHRYMEYLFFNLQRINFSSLNRGSTQPLLSQTDLKNSSLALPNESIISIFWEHVNSSFEKIDENIMEANSLVTMRDYLLPKLVSGGLRIPESEKEVEVKV